MTKMLKYSGILLLTLLTIPSFPQTQGVLGRGFFRNWSIGVGGGPNIFFGDLKVNDFMPVSSNMNEWRYAGTFTLTKQLGYVFALRGQVMYGEISGTNRVYRRDNNPGNQYFEGNILEYNLNTTINFSNFVLGHKPTRKFFVYVTLGGGVTTWGTKKKDLTTHELICENTTTGKWSIAAMAMAGLGAYVNMGDKVNLGIEWTIRGVNSDFMDATVGGFRYDMYSLAQITLTYNFNRKNPAVLKSPNSGPQMGPMPPKPEPPVKPAEKTQPETEYKKLPELITPLRFPTRDTIKQAAPENEFDSLGMSAESIDSSLLLDEESGPMMRGLSYRVQVFAFQTNEYTAESVRRKFNLQEPVYKEFTDEWYRYTVGSFKTLKEAKAHLNKIRRNGVHDAFIARYSDGIRISSHPKH